MRYTLLQSAVSLLALLGTSAHAQSSTTPPRVGGEVRIERLPTGMSVYVGSSNRAVIGVTLAASSLADTAGVRIDAVDAGGPAAAAGVKAGDVISAINGTSLRVSRSDADDAALSGTGQRRLQRVLSKAKPGDDVDLRLMTNGQTRAVTVKTVSATDLNRVSERRIGISRDDNRAAVGISVGGSGRVRDSLGLFVSSVVANGPAEKAGIIEGDRIAAVNGVDVRVPREDVDDARASSARVDRFVREVQKVAVGGQVTLRVFGGGRYREVNVTAVKATDLPLREFPFGGGSGVLRINGDDIRMGSDDMRREIERAMERVREMGSQIRLQIRTDGDSAGVSRVRTTPRRLVRVVL